MLGGLAAVGVLYFGSEMVTGMLAESAVEDLNPIHGENTDGDSSEIEALSDDELLNSANNPRDDDDDGLVVNTKTGGLMNGNTRATELKKRSGNPNSKIEPGTKVKITEYTPDDSMFID